MSPETPSAPRERLVPLEDGREVVGDPTTAVVVGGGIAGVAAATVLAERGVEVTLVEREGFLGGRAGAWSDTLESGESFEMERGFHAFFRQYYNLRALLRRIDPELDLLVPLDDYPILGPGGAVQSFQGLPRRTPANLLTLTLRSPALGFRDVLEIDRGRAMEMLRYDPDRTYAKWDDTTAKEYLDSLNFPPGARRLFFDVFAHSFFNPEEEMSAAELLMMFHFYFTGNPEGLIFDVARAPFSRAIWNPFAEHLRSLGVTIRTGWTARRVERSEPGSREGGWRVLGREEKARVGDEGAARHTTGGGAQGSAAATVEGDDLVLALSVPELKKLVAASPDLEDPRWRSSVESLSVTNPFAVWRLWLDRPTDPARSPFVGTTGLGPIDNISLYHLFEDESRAWHQKHGGAVVELHAYAIDEDVDDDGLREQLLEGMHRLYPETREARIVHDRYFVRRDCPSFAPGSHASRPPVGTPFGNVALAGDFVKLPIPSALMERAAASGFLAANRLLARHGVRSEPIRSIPGRGMLARLFS